MALALRVAIGAFFVYHGLSKFGLFGEGGFGRATNVFAEADVPVPGITAPILAVVETVGGLALIVGLLARIFAILLAGVVTFEIILVKLPQSVNPLNYLFELALLAVLIIVAWIGPGAWALEE